MVNLNCQLAWTVWLKYLCVVKLWQKQSGLLKVRQEPNNLSLDQDRCTGEIADSERVITRGSRSSASWIGSWSSLVFLFFLSLSSRTTNGFFIYDCHVFFFTRACFNTNILWSISEIYAFGFPGFFCALYWNFRIWK